MKISKLRETKWLIHCHTAGMGFEVQDGWGQLFCLPFQNHNPMAGVQFMWFDCMEDTSDFGLINPAPRCLISAATRSPWPRVFACLPIATSTKSPKLYWGRPKPMCSLSAAMGTCIPLSAPARSWGRRRQPDCSTRSPQLWPTATMGGWCCGTSSYGNSSLRMKKGKSCSWPDSLYYYQRLLRAACLKDGNEQFFVAYCPDIGYRTKGGDYLWCF